MTLYHQSRCPCSLHSQACHWFSAKVQRCRELGQRDVLLTRDGQIARDVVSDRKPTEMFIDSILFIFLRKQLRSEGWVLVGPRPFLLYSNLRFSSVCYCPSLRDTCWSSALVLWCLCHPPLHMPFFFSGALSCFPFWHGFMLSLLCMGRSCPLTILRHTPMR